MTITNLEKFALEQIFRPYANVLFNADTRFDRMSKDYNLDTVLDLFIGKPEWEKLVMKRIKLMDFKFPDYIQHPLVEYIKLYLANQD